MDQEDDTLARRGDEKRNLIPFEDCLRLAQEYDPEVPYADVLASLLQHFLTRANLKVAPDP